MKRGVDLDRLRPQVGTRPSHTGLKLGLLLVAGVVVGLLAMAVTSVIFKNVLLTRINSIAASLDTQRVTRLRDASDNEQIQADYRYLRDKLAQLKTVNADSRFVYLMARNQAGEVYFLADSEPVNSPDYSARGEVYPEASEDLHAVLEKGRSVVEGPVKDSYGTWLSAMAPIVDDESYRLTALVGMDVPATTYALVLGLAGGVPVLLSVLSAAFLYIRHQNRRHRRENVQFRAEMISIASHELRTPLTGLRWSQENLLSHKLTPERQKRAMEIMYDSTLKLQESIEDILQLASIEAGRYRLYKKTADLRALLESVVAIQQLAAERMNVAVVFTDSWPEQLVLECDTQRLKRVFNNVLSNAIKYSRPDTKVVIGYERAQDGGHIVSFADQGIGIPSNEQASVWEGFYRASNTIAHDINGTGMGLYLTREIIEQHGGRAWLESQEGVGTTVYVELPDTSLQDDKVPPLQTRG